MFKVVLDPGHGGKETGALNKFVSEKNINLRVANACKSYLEQFTEISVKMTRYQDTEVTLQNRCDIANLSQANLFVSIHHNASGQNVKGFEIYHYTNSAQGKKISEIIESEFKQLGQFKRFVGSGLYAGSKQGDYFVLANTHMPAVLTEFAFLDSVDYKKIDEESELIAEGKAIARAIVKYFGIETIDFIEDSIEEKSLEERIKRLEKMVDSISESLKRNNII